MNPQGSNTEFLFQRLYEEFPRIVVLFPVAFALFVLGLIVLFKPETKLRTLVIGLIVIGVFAAIHIPLALMFVAKASWLVVLIPILAIALIYVGLMYLRDCQSIHPVVATVLGLLRCTVYAILAFVFLLPGCQTYDESKQISQVLFLFDVSDSMTQVKDDLLQPGQKPESLLYRQEKVVQFLTSTVGPDKKPRASFIDQITEKSPVKAFRFGSIADEMDVLELNKKDKMTKEDWLKFLKPDKKDIVVPDDVKAEDREKYRAKVQDLIDSLRNGTNVPGSALQVAKAEAANYTQAIVIFSDGQSNLGSDEARREFLARARNAGVHVFTVGVGEYRTPASIRIEDLQVPQVARPDDKFPVRVLVVGTGLNDEEFDVFLELVRVKDANGQPLKGEKKFVLPAKKGKFKGAGENPQDTVEFAIDIQELKGITISNDKNRDLEGEWEFIARVPRHPKESFPEEEHVSQPPARVQVQNKELRVLLFAGGPTLDYQFLRTLFVREVDEKRMELSVFLQTGGLKDVDQDVPQERLLTHFPDKLGKDDPKDKFSSLNMYDVIIAIDPDWTVLDKSQIKLIERWVNTDAGGLIFIAGPVNTFYLARQSEELKPLRNILPVELKDSRLSPFTIGLGIDLTRPYVLNFPPAAMKGFDFLKLDEAGENPVAGWDKFFWGDRKPEAGKPPLRGFFNYYPVKGIRPDTTVLAEFMGPDNTRLEDPKRSYQPYIATMRYGAGKTVYLSSGETRRLRGAKDAFHERFWIKLARFASSGSTSQKKYGQIVLGRKYPTGTLAFEAQIKGPDLLPLSKDSRPTLVVKKRNDQDAKPMMVDLKAKPTQGDWAGWFQGPVKLREPGEYILEVPIPNTSETLNHAIEVYQPRLEEANIRENHKELYKLASDANPVLKRLTAENLKEVEKLLRPSSLDYNEDGKEGTRLFLPLPVADAVSKCLLDVPPKRERTKGAMEDLWDKGAATGLNVSAFHMLWIAPLVIGLVALLVCLILGQNVAGLVSMGIAGFLALAVWIGDYIVGPDWAMLKVDFSFALTAVVALLAIEWLTRKLLKLA